MSRFPFLFGSRGNRSLQETNRAGRSLRVEALEDRYLLSASLVQDIHPTGDSNPTAMVNVNGTLFFDATNASTRGLYRSDGSAAGTQLIRAFPEGITQLTNVNGTLFFTHRPGNVSYIHDLYKSDGTDGGTVLVTRHNSGMGEEISHLTAAGNRLFYQQFHLSRPRPTLWTTDGGAPQGLIVFGSPMQNLTNVNGTLFFTAWGPNLRELYKSDGTVAGTGQVKDINRGGDSSPSALASVGGLLYFSADDGVHGRELWVSDGTDPGTYMVGDINPGPASSDPQHIIEGYYTYALFSADDGVHGRELWMTPGFQTGDPEMILDIRPGPQGSNPQNLTDASGYLFFTADDGIYGRELWFSDWLPTGTYILKDINPGPASSNPDKLTGLYGYWVYFSADNGQDGRELWVSDWTTDGTYMDHDINFGIPGSNPDYLVELNGYILFAATEASVGRELFIAAPWVGPGGGSAPGGDAGLGLSLLYEERAESVSSLAVQANEVKTPPAVALADTAHSADAAVDVLVGLRSRRTELDQLFATDLTLAFDLEL